MKKTILSAVAYWFSCHESAATLPRYRTANNSTLSIASSVEIKGGSLVFEVAKCHLQWIPMQNPVSASSGPTLNNKLIVSLDSNEPRLKQRSWTWANVMKWQVFGGESGNGH